MTEFDDITNDMTAAVEAGAIALYPNGHHPQCAETNPCRCYFQRYRNDARRVLLAVSHLSPRTDAEEALVWVRCRVVGRRIVHEAVETGGGTYPTWLARCGRPLGMDVLEADSSVTCKGCLKAVTPPRTDAEDGEVEVRKLITREVVEAAFNDPDAVRLANADADYELIVEAAIRGAAPLIVRAAFERIPTARAGADRLRDLTRRLGFGDNITEPMADNDTIVEWVEQESRDAAEWRESQQWRIDCEVVKGHDPLNDCYECNPMLAAPGSPAPVGDMDAAVTAVEERRMIVEGLRAVAATYRPLIRRALLDEADRIAALPHLSPRPAPVADREEVTALLATHDLFWEPPRPPRCRCGVELESDGPGAGVTRSHRDHIAGVLIEAGYGKGGQA